MVRTFFAIVFVFPLLLKLFPSLNLLVQKILGGYIANFSGLHNLTLFINNLIFGNSQYGLLGLPHVLLSIIMIVFVLALILKMLRIL